MRKILTVFGALSLSVMALTSCDGNVDLKTPSENLETESKLEGEFTVDQTTIKFSKLGEGQLINAYVGDTLVKDVEYTSSKPEIAEVHNGYVVAKSAGKSVITATYEDKSVEVVVTVESEFKTEI